MAKPTEIVLSDEDRAVLERWARRPKTAQALAFRSRIVLAAAAGERSVDIAKRLVAHGHHGGQVAGAFRAARHGRAA